MCEEFTEEISEQHAGMTPLALACALNKLPAVKVEKVKAVHARLPSVGFRS